MTDSELLSLHRYYIWANRMRTLFERVLSDTQHVSARPELWLAGDAGLFMSYWYGGLYVVVEGYRALKCSGVEVDSLLESPLVDLLKKYRNGAFHYQKKYIDQRFAGFVGERDSVSWVRRLNEALGGFFLASLRERGSSSPKTREE